MSQLGIGVMLNMLGGNETTVNTLRACLGKKIKTVSLNEADNRLEFVFEDGTEMKMWDNGQSCCENRYMRTDDNLTEFAGAMFKDVAIKDAPDQPDEYGEVHEIQFLEIVTDKGVLTMSNHNEHNGYYGGFSIVASL